MPTDSPRKNAFHDRLPPIDRAASMRWGRYAGADVIPLWVADMDFAAPQAVQQAVRAVADEQAYCYTMPPAGLAEAVAAYCQRRYEWTFGPESIVWLPGLVSGLHAVVRAVSPSGSPVLVMPPIYPPFLSAPAHQGAAALLVSLAAEGTRYRIDTVALESALAQAPECRLLMLCHPHNPVGRAWFPEELALVADLARRFDLVVCSDEVHCDLLLVSERSHLPFATLDGMAERTITLMAPSKTYNVAGLGAAWAVVSNTTLRQRLRSAMQGIVPHVGAFGFAAMAACVGGACEAWRLGLLDYLRGNARRVKAAADAMGLPMAVPEATFLAWLDARHIPDAHRRIEGAGVGLSNGADFGAPGFLRLNFGTQRQLLDEALSRMARALRA